MEVGLGSKGGGGMGLYWSERGSDQYAHVCERKDGSRVE